MSSKEGNMIKRRNPFQHSLQFLIFTIFYYIRCGFCLDTDTINSTIVLRDSDTIESAGKQFVLGFFSPNGTTKRYMGIWYYVSRTSPAWVANRENPLNDSSGTITIHSNGNIVLMNGNGDIVWSTNATSSSSVMNTTAQLLDSGNLVLKDISAGITIWESHKHPVDSYLPTMRFSHNPRTGVRIGLNSWRTFNDPGRGSFTSGIDAVGVPQYYIWENGVPRWRSGPWNGRIFIGVSGMNSAYEDGYSIAADQDGTYYFTRNFRHTFISRHYLNADGFIVRGGWDEGRNDWNITWVGPANDCDFYNKCGPNSVCSIQDLPICSCLRGYEPRNIRQWERGVWSGGCTRRTRLQCERANNATDRNREDGFTRLTLVKLPDFMRQYSFYTECASMCLRNCSCLAYAHDPGIGCMFWSENLIDIQKFQATIGSDLYVRVAYSELEKEKNNKVVIVISVISSSVAAFIFLFLAWWMYKCIGKMRSSGGGKSKSDLSKIVLQRGMDKVNIKELPLYSFKILENATCNFAQENKLGEGGFGPVYKGELGNERENIAVKRLSAASGQGFEEFMNEVAVISKLQHRNLVRLLGCCVDKEEKMLIYEYLSNRSLDVYLFEKSQNILDWKKQSQNILDWKKRFNIMEGIGRGLQYLHRDSRLRIIHRDLKPSNILLDEYWNPKISDFGMARIFGGNQDQANTGKVVGTYGYMAPEYAMGGRFSEKSDVFSYGVLVLEIISGTRNTSFYNEEFSLGLLGYAWKLWKDDNTADFIDRRISNNPSFQPEIMRCMHIGLLCVQENPTNRPNISNVLLMLCSEIMDLPVPEHPGFTDRWNRTNVASSPSTRTCSANTISLTVLDGR